MPLNRALVADPYFVVALLQKAQWMERHAQIEEAVRAYRNLLDAAPTLERLPPAMRAALEHGRDIVRAADDRIAAAVRAAIGDRPVRSERFLHCLDVLAGRRKIYVHEPAGLHFPYLPAIQFFDRALFPWFAALEAATPAIFAELQDLIRDGVPNAPYIQVAAGQPVNQWSALNHSLDWGALFLWKNGEPVSEMVARCPRTAAAMRAAPLLDIPGRGPTVMFSTLQPHTRIPPHTGVTNTRAVVHLPLIVPPGCGFRVGSETRAWEVGAAWAFDDTIEHEAWNDSGETRVILIIDAWNPYLDEEEKELLRVTNQVLARPGMGVPLSEGN